MYASRDRSTGPVHGAEIGPETRPIPNAPAGPVPPTVLSRFCRLVGSCRSNPPNMLTARASSRATIGRTTHGLPSHVPNAAPDRATASPRVVYRVAIPRT